MEVKETGIMTGVQDSSSIFLKYLERINITLGQRMEVLDKMDFDGSMILIAGEKEVSISAQAAQNIIIRIN
jgi:DtxR family Mn-dependent transcriptional regulator